MDKMGEGRAVKVSEKVGRIKSRKDASEIKSKRCITSQRRQRRGTSSGKAYF